MVYFVECDQKIEDLTAHLLNLVTQLECTKKVAMENVIWNEDRGAQIVSLEKDIEEHFKDLYELCPRQAHDISIGNDMLNALFQNFCKVHCDLMSFGFLQ